MISPEFGESIPIATERVPWATIGVYTSYLRDGLQTQALIQDPQFTPTPADEPLRLKASIADFARADVPEVEEVVFSDNPLHLSVSIRTRAVDTIWEIVKKTGEAKKLSRKLYYSGHSSQPSSDIVVPITVTQAEVMSTLHGWLTCSYLDFSPRH